MLGYGLKGDRLAQLILERRFPRVDPLLTSIEDLLNLADIFGFRKT